MWCWISVAIQAPSHANWQLLINLFHAIDTTMACNTANTACHVGTVVEIGVIWQIMDANPSDWISRGCTLSKGFQLRTVRGDCRMTVHADRSVWNRGKGCILHRGVAIAAIQPDFACMESMREWDRLQWRIADIRCSWCASPIDEGDEINRGKCQYRSRNRSHPINPLHVSRFTIHGPPA